MELWIAYQYCTGLRSWRAVAGVWFWCVISVLIPQFRGLSWWCSFGRRSVAVLGTNARHRTSLGGCFDAVKGTSAAVCYHRAGSALVLWAGSMKMWITCSSSDFFAKIWSLMYDWIGFVTVIPGYLLDHLLHVSTSGGFSKQICMSLTIIWRYNIWFI